MSFNIRTSRARDGFNAWRHRCDLAIRLIERFAGDFVGLQEAWPDQIGDIRQALPQYGLLAKSRDAMPHDGEATPLLYRCDRWAVDPAEYGTFWLSDTPMVPGSKSWWNFCPRIVTWGRFVESKSGRGVYVYNTHFDHLSKMARHRSARLLARTIAARRRPEPVVVTGDFNCRETGRAVAYLTASPPKSPVRLIDTFRSVHPEGRQAGTYHGFRGGTHGPKIDYIFALSTIRVLSADIVREDQHGRYPSDHFPITAEVSIPGKGA
jgi:endonuclease/exonuclease/phosphatase family metal-dependent hydrolase